MIHEANPQSQPEVITIFAHVVRPYVPTFQNLAKQNKFQVKLAGLWVWPSGSMMTPVLLFYYFKAIENFSARVLLYLRISFKHPVLCKAVSFIPVSFPTWVGKKFQCKTVTIQNIIPNFKHSLKVISQNINFLSHSRALQPESWCLGRKNSMYFNLSCLHFLNIFTHLLEFKFVFAMLKWSYLKKGSLKA